ncbi:hypothetical protein CONLIGDRAFT_634008 [Coniochaeta ligniaria NRRL 30616]|uniref:Uncharacterized protein n=1 Tax=Coniochaeta ligniaria NRRL 30616 TaxID=1408157 RepID=A0A1J7JJ41_9PEZI|nr:hypothetical protein CONLIGDRAFT_634008 [Coniochaeta ligniaria NRRL 30616]
MGHTSHDPRGSSHLCSFHLLLSLLLLPSSAPLSGRPPITPSPLRPIVPSSLHLTNRPIVASSNNRSIVASSNNRFIIASSSLRLIIAPSSVCLSKQGLHRQRTEAVQDTGNNSGTAVRVDHSE